MAIGRRGKYQANTINAAGGKKSRSSSPRKGATGWSDTWMISSKAPTRTAWYKWMNYIISAQGERDVTVYFG
jgi:putative spermidine/putrescine transport system substrate-binding protein